MSDQDNAQQVAANKVSDTPPARTSHPYYMYDSIHEMGQALGKCLGNEPLGQLRSIADTLARRGAERVFVVGCGTSLNIGKALVYCMEQLAGLPTRAIDSFEFTSYPPPDLNAQATVIAISHSGGSIATVRAAEFARQRGAYTLCMVGNPKGKLAAAGDVTVLDPAGIEVNGPKIRSYTVTCFQGLLLSLLIREAQTGVKLDPQLFGLPAAVDRFIAAIEPAVQALATEWAGQVASYMVAGSGSDAGNAVEIALKILETITPPANGYDIEEYTHGPIFALRPNRALIVLQATPQGKQRCVEAAYAASAVTRHILVITEDVAAGWPEQAIVWQIPGGWGDAAFLLSPMPAQIMVYYLCLALGTSPDHATESSAAMPELYRRAFPPGTH